MMRSGIRLIAVVVLLFSVAAVFVAPAVDLEPTALRAARAALLVMLALAGAAAAIVRELAFPSPHAHLSAYVGDDNTGCRDILIGDCIRRC